MTDCIHQRPKSMLECDTFFADDSGNCTLNGEELVDDEESDSVPTPWLIEELLIRHFCPFCNATVPYAEHTWSSNGDLQMRDWHLIHCPNCAFWQFFGKVGNFDTFPSGISWQAYWAKARSFEEVLPEGIASEIATALRRNSKNWTNICSTPLEKLVREVFRANYTDCEAIHLGKPGDGGVDVLFVDADSKEWLVQVKGRVSGKSESVETVRNLLGVMTLQNVLRGIVVSTADSFTHAAKSAVDIAFSRGSIIKLIDRGKLNRMLDPLIQTEPWTLPLRKELQGDHRAKRMLRKLVRELLPLKTSHFERPHQGPSAQLEFPFHADDVA